MNLYYMNMKDALEWFPHLLGMVPHTFNHSAQATAYLQISSYL